MSHDSARRKSPIRDALIVVATLVCLIAVLFPVTAGHSPAEWIPCVSNLKQLGVGTLIYPADCDDRFPLAANWSDAITPYTKEVSYFKCPVVAKEQPNGFGYAYNSLMSGAKDEKLEMVTPLIYDSTSLAWQSSDPFTSLPNPGRHPGGDHGKNCIGYADGHVKFVVVEGAP